jgi:excisionase family DNA binding protein
MLTIAQIAEQYPKTGSKSTILRAVRRGELKATRVGVQGIWLVTAADLEAWLTELAIC